MSNIIYKITNKINNKIYIGLTTRSLEERWNEHISVAFNPNSKDYNAIFKKAIRKYGVLNWDLEIIDTATTIQELKEKEQYWIKYYNSFAFDKNSNGYNSTRGGDGVTGLNVIPVCQFDIITGSLINSYKSLKEAEESIGCRVENIGKSNRSCNGYCFVYKEDIDGLSNKDIINYIHSLYPYLVYQLDLEGNLIKIYRNTTEAALETNSSQGNIISCCLGERRMAKGYQWAYQRNISEKINKPIKDKVSQGISVVQYGKNGKKIQIWESIAKASQILNISDSHISSCCKGNRNSAGNFQWRYLKDNIENLPPIYTKRKVKCLETGEIFDTCNHAAKHFGYSQATVKKCCIDGKTKKEYHFEWAD
jgi:group I intron endonuclease